MARKAAAPAKRPRRQPRTGTIRFKAGREKPFEACFPITGSATRYKAFQSDEDAAAWLDDLAIAQKDKTRDLVGGSMLVQDYLPMWLELRRGHIGPKTLEAYTYYCEYACGEGGLGRLRMDEVAVLIGQRMVNRLAADGFQNTAQLKSVLYQAFDYAFDALEYIKRNPFRKVRVPYIERKNGIALTKAERARMLDAAALDDGVSLRRPGEQASAPAPLLPFWHLTSRLAFRRGEASALKWSAIDFERGIITIGESRGRLGTTHIEGKTKTKKTRYAPMYPDLIDLIRDFKTTQMRAALSHGWQWKATGYVFVDDRTGAPLNVDHLRYRWGRIKKVAKLPAPMTIHDCRHTALSILALDGMPQSALMALAGHKTAAMSDHYTDHASVDDVRRAMMG